MGILYGVSVGAGDPELMTIKAVKILNFCQVIAVPRTGNQRSLALEIARQAVDVSEKKILFLDFPMTRTPEQLEENYLKLSDMLCKELEYQDTAFLCLGDIGIYSTFSQIADLISQKGFKVERCAGVPSFCAAAAEMNCPLVSQDEILEILPYDCKDFSERLHDSGNKIIMKAGTHALDLKAHLTNGWAVSDCGLEHQKLYPDLQEIQENLSYFTIFYTKS